MIRPHLLVLVLCSTAFAFVGLGFGGFGKAFLLLLFCGLHSAASSTRSWFGCYIGCLARFGEFIVAGFSGVFVPSGCSADFGPCLALGLHVQDGLILFGRKATPASISIGCFIRRRSRRSRSGRSGYSPGGTWSWCCDCTCLYRSFSGFPFGLDMEGSVRTETDLYGRHKFKTVAISEDKGADLFVGLQFIPRTEDIEKLDLLRVLVSNHDWTV